MPNDLPRCPCGGEAEYSGAYEGFVSVECELCPFSTGSYRTNDEADAAWRRLCAAEETEAALERIEKSCERALKVKIGYVSDHHEWSSAALRRARGEEAE